MAELPKYETSNIQYKAMPELTRAAEGEFLKSNERVTNFLNQAGQYFQKQAVEYASDQAVEYAIRNPITKEQIDQARQTGDNPISTYLKGGSAYNEAIQKVLGQQIAGELRLEFEKHNQDILNQVELGEIPNQEEMLAKLKEPIQAHVEFLSTVDPQLAESYGAATALTARNNYLRGDTIFKQKQEEAAYINAQTTANNVIRDYGNYLTNHPDATDDQKEAYKQTVLKTAQDTSFSMSRKQAQLSDSLSKALQQTENDHHASAIAQKYRGKTIAEVLKLLPKDESNLAAYYNSSADKGSFAKSIEYELRLVNSDIAANDKLTRSLLHEAMNDIKNTRQINPALVNQINNTIDPASELAEDWAELQDQSLYIETLNKKSIDDIAADIEPLRAKDDDINQFLDRKERIRYEILTSYQSKLINGIKEKPVETIARRHGFYERLDFSNPEVLKEQIQNRRKNLDKYGDLYGFNTDERNAMVMTKQEASGLVAAYMNPETDAMSRLGILNIIDEGFGESNTQAMRQLTEAGLPTTAQLSSFLNNPDVTMELMSLDSKEKKAALQEDLKTSGESMTFDDIKEKIRLELADYEEVLRMNSPLNPSDIRAKMNEMVDMLSYYAINQMDVKGKGLSQGIDNAVALIANNHHIEKTFYIPKKYNGDFIGDDIDKREGILDKANLIKDHYLKEFNAVPFGSRQEGVSQELLEEEFNLQLKYSGEWRNTPDGSGLIYVIKYPDNTFTPIKNAAGEFLSFKFDDLSKTLPHTDVRLDYKKQQFNLGL